MRTATMLLAVVVLLGLGHTPAQADLCFPPVVQEESGYAYIVSLADALSYGKSALDRMGPKDPDSLSAGMLAHLLDLKIAKADFECARSQILPYAKSANEVIRMSAQGVAVVFTSLADLNDKSVAETKALLNAFGEGKMELGTFMERQAELGALYDTTWKALIPPVMAATYAVVEKDPATGLMSGLAMTASQRDEILDKLRGTFGDEITKGMQAGQIRLVVAAAILYEVIGLQQRRPRGQLD